MQSPVPSTIKALLFDHDGTLVDSETVHCQFWQEVLRGYQCELTDDDYRLQCVGVSEVHTAEIFKAQFSLPASIETLVAQKRQVAERFHSQHHYPLMPGVAGVIDTLAAMPLTLAVVSGSAVFALEASLRALHLRDKFACVASGETVANNKPAPDVYLCALAQLGLAPGECMAIEDTASGLQAAKSAGIYTCVIPNSFSAHQDFATADKQFASMAEWLDWFTSLPSQVV